MDSRRPPETASGYYVLHDFRRIDWEAWNERSADERERVRQSAIDFFEDPGDVEEGDFGLYSVHGHKADLLIIAMRSSLRELDTFERQFAQLDFAMDTERTTSALGVTEASGYTEAAADFFDPDAEAEPGIARYMNARLYPELPDAEYLSFYFMNKRRHPEENWYDLAYDERAEHVTRHGEIGRDYAGRVTQLITGSTGLDDWEWGVTLFTNDMVAVKELLTEMRFDPSTSRFAEFGPFYTADRFVPSELPAFLAGEPIGQDESAETHAPSIGEHLRDLTLPTELPDEAHVVLVPSDASTGTVEGAVDELRGNFEHYDSHIETVVVDGEGSPVVVSAWETERAAETAAGFLAELPGATDTQVGIVGDAAPPKSVATGDETATDVRSVLEDADVYAGQPHGEDIHALVRFSTADRDTLEDKLSTLTSGFDRYDTHVGTSLYATRDGVDSAIVSLWETQDAAETAAQYLDDVPGARAHEAEDGFATMGLFYRVKPEYRQDFLDTFDTVGELLAEMDGHRNTDLLVNVEDHNDMFIASRWRDRDAAMGFFRSDEFSDTVQWGRDVLADRPRHVFLV